MTVRIKAIKTTVDGIIFRSRLEAVIQMYVDLKTGMILKSVASSGRIPES